MTPDPLASLPPHRGMLIILSSPSGAGKSTIAKRLRDWDPTISFSISATTRASRPGETDGREYHFRDVDAFRALVENGQMLEHAEVFGNLYGSPKEPVMDALAQGRDVLFDIDWQGGQQVRNSMASEDVVSIFLLPPSIAELERRLNSRGQDSEETIRGRMTRSRDEISHWDAYDYVLVNSDLEHTEAHVRAIIAAERLRRNRQPGLVDSVRALNTEFEAWL